MQTTLRIAASLALFASCTPLSYRQYDPRYDVPPSADVATEIGALADELTARAEARTTLGSARVVIDDLVPLEPRSHRYRQVTLERQATRDTEATLRHELEMALAQHVNVVGGTVISGTVGADLAERAGASGATHAVVGTFQREGADLDVALQLVDLRSDWLVATARRRIVRFEPDVFRRPELSAGDGRSTASAEARTVDAVPEPAMIFGTRDGGPPLSGELQPVPDAEARFVDTDLPPEFDVPPDAEVRFDEGPAAARLRALDPGWAEAEAPVESSSGERRLPD